jgi:hypothetical protein
MNIIFFVVRMMAKYHPIFLLIILLLFMGIFAIINACPEDACCFWALLY